MQQVVGGKRRLTMVLSDLDHLERGDETRRGAERGSRGQRAARLMSVSSVQILQDIAHLLGGRNDTHTLTDIAQDIDLDAEVVRLFARSFDAAGQLSVRQYPQLEQLRREIIQIEASVTKTMEALAKSLVHGEKSHRGDAAAEESGEEKSG